MFITLVGKANKHQLGPHDTIGKVLKGKCLKCPHIVHLDLICMSYNQIRGHKPLESRGQINSDWGMLYIVGKIILRAIRYCPQIFKINLI
jgi:hypothetical protein